MSGELGTTNLLLGVMAAVSVLEGLALVVMGFVGFRAYRRMMVLVDGYDRKFMFLVDSFDTRYVAPTMTRVNAILDDVNAVSAKVKEETDRVDHAIHYTLDRIDDTADRVRSNVRAKTSRAVGFVRGLRVALEQMLTTS